MCQKTYFPTSYICEREAFIFYVELIKSRVKTTRTQIYVEFQCLLRHYIQIQTWKERHLCNNSFSPSSLLLLIISLFPKLCKQMSSLYTCVPYLLCNLIIFYPHIFWSCVRHQHIHMWLCSIIFIFLNHYQCQRVSVIYIIHIYLVFRRLR